MFYERSLVARGRKLLFVLPPPGGVSLFLLHATILFAIAVLSVTITIATPAFTTSTASVTVVATAVTLIATTRPSFGLLQTAPLIFAGAD